MGLLFAIVAICVYFALRDIAILIQYFFGSK